MEKRNSSESEQAEEEKIKIRHTITAEETFTLAKDVFDIRCFIKNVYANRAVIARRLNVLSLSVSAAFTLLYIAYMIFGGFFTKLGLGVAVTVGVLAGVYFALIVCIITVTLCSRGAKTRNVRKISKSLSYFRLGIRLLSMSVTIAALALATSGGDYAAPNLAVDVLIIVFSVIVLIFQIIPLLFGGLGKMARWLLSPVKAKFRFSTVALEWYELAVTGGAQKGAAKKVSSKYFDDIGRVIDNILLPSLGKKYVSAVKPTALVAVVERAPEEDRPLLEGTLKSIFEYATECGYVTFNPCKDLNFEGSVEEEAKEKKTIKQRFMGLGKKLGKSVLDKYIASTTDDEE